MLKPNLIGISLLLRHATAPTTLWRKRNPRLPGSSPWFKTRWRGNWPLCATRSRASPTCLNRSRRRVEVSQCGVSILYRGSVARRAARQGVLPGSSTPRGGTAGAGSRGHGQVWSSYASNETDGNVAAVLRHLRRSVGPNQPHACPPVDGILGHDYPGQPGVLRAVMGHLRRRVPSPGCGSGELAVGPRQPVPLQCLLQWQGETLRALRAVSERGP